MAQVVVGGAELDFPACPHLCTEDLLSPTRALGAGAMLGQLRQEGTLFCRRE